ncbi:hypothetical protein GCM10010430_44740 [Kitasatospora cystarginea]|uniref:Uncharacterized protein n=1 Tax=Kitasatospora cystarginea TaxID=58350 RepID=A0ABN3EEK9_9ACTN
MGEGAGGVALPVIYAQATVSAYVHEWFSALLDRDCGNPWVGHQDDLAHGANDPVGPTTRGPVWVNRRLRERERLLLDGPRPSVNRAIDR